MAFTKGDKEYLEELFTRNNKLLKDELVMIMDIKLALLRDDILDEFDKKFVKYKSDVMNHVSSFAKEIDDNRDERTVQSEQIIRNDKRIEKLEESFA